MSVESEKDLESLRKIGRIVASTVQEMFRHLRVGMTTHELDQVGAEILARHGANSAPKLCYGFNGSTIISINEEAAHAIPGNRRIHEGDLVNIDVSAELGGYFADTGYTRPVGRAHPITHRLCAASQEALAEALKCVKAGSPISSVEHAIRKVARKRGFSVIENLAGHGVGRHIHEEPNYVPDFGNRKDKRRFKKNCVLTIEPFLSTGPRHAYNTSDGWTLVTPKGNYTAQFEHTIIVTDGDPIILTAA
ncbi:type I methionyl aminopeptidase [Puniceicoccaceae bacterium K14]|nr:type I methionyl aminopeptidase [Puniceicoccaceae bacterium K14]